MQAPSDTSPSLSYKPIWEPLWMAYKQQFTIFFRVTLSIVIVILIVTTFLFWISVPGDTEVMSDPHLTMEYRMGLHWTNSLIITAAFLVHEPHLCVLYLLSMIHLSRNSQCIMSKLEVVLSNLLHSFSWWLHCENLPPCMTRNWLKFIWHEFAQVRVRVIYLIIEIQVQFNQLHNL